MDPARAIRFILKLPPERASGRRGLVDDNFTQPGQIAFQLAPKPGRHHFNRGAFQPLDVIQVTVIHAVDQRSHGIGDPLVIVNPANLRVHFSFDVNLDLETVAMHLAAFVVSREAGKGVGRLKAEILDQSGTHQK